MKPKGIISLFIASDGHVVAHAADFHEDHPGGYTTREAQEQRSKQAMWHQAAGEMCNSDFAKVISSHMAAQIIHDLCQKKGYRVEQIAIGYED